MDDQRNASTYQPINTLKRVADNVWLVDGPLIRFGPAWLKIPVPTRMTVIRLGSEALFVHSPTPLTAELKTEIRRIGQPRWIIAPNRIHYWWTPEWKTSYPEADAYLAPRVKERAGRHIDFDFLPLDREQGYPWDPDIETLLVTGSYMTEVDFFHRPSRTLILTDLMENFEAAKTSPLMRLLAWLGGCLDPDGGMPRDIRTTFLKHKSGLRDAVEKMISWNPERIILAHGRWYETDGGNQLRRAFRWLLT